MKKVNYFIMLVNSILLFSAAVAQKDSSGIYKTAEDFKSRKLSLAINCKNEKHRIKTNIFFNDSEIKVKHKNRTYTFLKSEVFGYRTCEQKEFRFVDNREYEIINPREQILIYKYMHLAHSPKNADQYPVKYFFSKDAFSPLQDLTIQNLKQAFPDNHKFHDALDVHFSNNSDLINYDSFHKMYKLNWIFKN